MSTKEQIEAFELEIESVITRFAHEFNLPAVAAIGVLQLAQRRILDRMLKEESEDE